MIYLNDLIIYSNTFEEHLERLDLIRLKECGLKFTPEKVPFFRKQVSFLGHLVSADGIKTDPEKIEKVKSRPMPKHPEELNSLL